VLRERNLGSKKRSKSTKKSLGRKIKKGRPNKPGRKTNTLSSGRKKKRGNGAGGKREKMTEKKGNPRSKALRFRKIQEIERHRKRELLGEEPRNIRLWFENTIPEEKTRGADCWNPIFKKKNKLSKMLNREGRLEGFL